MVYKSNKDAQPETSDYSVLSDRFGCGGDWLCDASAFRERRGCDGGADNAVSF